MLCKVLGALEGVAVVLEKVSAVLHEEVLVVVNEVLQRRLG